MSKLSLHNRLRDARLRDCGTWDAGRGTRDAGRGTRDAGRGTRDAGRRTRDYGIASQTNTRSPLSQVLCPKSFVPSPLSQVLCPKSFVPSPSSRSPEVKKYFSLTFNTNQETP